MELDPASYAGAPPQPTSALNIPRPTELPPTDHITLDVDGRKYRTRKSTLQHCEYFSNMFSGRWNLELLPDGSLPIDADPEIFPILLGYIRRPAVYPLLWTKEKGFDYVTYTKLLAEADFFGLGDLKEWIQKKKYMSAVTTSYRICVDGAQTGKWFSIAPELDRDMMNDLREMTAGPEFSNIEVLQSFQVDLPGKGRYLCSEDLPGHDTPLACLGSYCAVGWEETNLHELEKMWDYDEVPKSIATIVRHVEVNHEACLRDYVEAKDREDQN